MLLIVDDVRLGRTESPTDAGDVLAAAWSPDGTMIATGSRPDGTVRLVDSACGRSRAVAARPQPVRAIAWSPTGGSWS